jgi:hypothetical protein
VANAGSVPHSNQAFVARPFGVTLALSTAAVADTEAAARVETNGGAPTKDVVNPATELLLAPRLLEAQIR